MLVKNLFDVMPTDTTLTITNQRDTTTFTSTIANVKFSDRNVYKRKVVSIMATGNKAVSVITT